MRKCRHSPLQYQPCTSPRPPRILELFRWRASRKQKSPRFFFLAKHTRLFSSTREKEKVNEWKRISAKRDKRTHCVQRCAKKRKKKEKIIGSRERQMEKNKREARSTSVMIFYYYYYYRNCYYTITTTTTTITTTAYTLILFKFFKCIF